MFTARLTQADLVTKTDFDAKLLNLNKKINSNETKHLLAENKFKKLQAFDSSYFRDKNHFDDDGTQNYRVFQPINRYFKKIASTEIISSWKSKGLSDEIIKSPATSNNSLDPELSSFINKIKVKSNGSCLKQDKITYTHGAIVIIYTVYELSSNLNNFDFILESCLFGAAKFTKNADIGKYKHSGYGIGFDARGTFSFPNSSFGQNVTIFGADMSSSVHVDNKKKRHFNSWSRSYARIR